MKHTMYLQRPHQDARCLGIEQGCDWSFPSAMHALAFYREQGYRAWVISERVMS